MEYYIIISQEWGIPTMIWNELQDMLNENKNKEQDAEYCANIYVKIVCVCTYAWKAACLEGIEYGNGQAPLGSLKGWH